MKEPLSLRAQRGRPRECDGPAIQRVSELREDDASLSVRAAVSQVVRDRTLVAKNAFQLTNERRLIVKYRRMRKALRYREREKELPFRAGTKVEHGVRKHSWTFNHPNEWRDAEWPGVSSRAGWSIECGSYVDGYLVYKLRRDLAHPLVDENDANFIAALLERFRRSGFAWSVVNGEVQVIAPTIVGHGS